jgi:hypothetical protein
MNGDIDAICCSKIERKMPDKLRVEIETVRGILFTIRAS